MGSFSEKWGLERLIVSVTLESPNSEQDSSLKIEYGRTVSAKSNKQTLKQTKGKI